MELREFHRTRLEKGLEYTIEKGEVVIVYDEGHPRGMWRLVRIENLIEGADGKVRRVCVRVISKNGRVTVLRRPIQHIYPLEVRSEPLTDGSTRNESSGSDPTANSEVVSNMEETVKPNPGRGRPKRMAACNAWEIMRVLMDDHDD